MHLAFWCGPDVGGRASAPLKGDVAVFPDAGCATDAFESTFPIWPTHRRRRVLAIHQAQEEWRQYEASTGVRQGSYAFANLSMRRIDPRSEGG